MTTDDWRKKIKKLEGKGNKLVLEAIDKATREHGRCCENVLDTISLWYTKYATDGKITYSEALKLNRMLELVEDIKYDLDDSTEKEKAHLDVLLAALLALYSKDLDFSLSLNIFEQPWASDGILYPERLRDNKVLLLAYLQTDLKRAFARGDSLVQILAQVKKRFKTSTNSLSSQFESEATNYEGMMIRDWLVATGRDKYQWITILDGKQCEECNTMNGLIFYVKDFEPGVTAPQLHRHCRCQIGPA